MAKHVRVDAEAEQEIGAAMDWYESQRPGLGAEFLDEIRVAIRSLEESGPEWSDGRPWPIGSIRSSLAQEATQRGR